GDHGDAAAEQGGDADVAIGVDGQGVEILIAGHAGQHPAAVRRGPGLAADLSGAGNLEGPEAAGLGFGDVEAVAGRGEADAVGGDHREGDFLDQAAVGLGVPNAAAVPVAGARLAQVAEPEAAMRIEHDVVRAAELHVAGAAIEDLHRAGLQVDALDAAAAIVLGLKDRPALARLLVPFEAAIVADIAFAVGTDGGTVRPAAGCRDHLLRAVRQHPRQRAGG